MHQQLTHGKGFWFISGTNTGEKKLTAINNAKKGVAYIVECGNKTNVTGIDKAGSFESISEAWTPTAVGDYHGHAEQSEQIH